MSDNLTTTIPQSILPEAPPYAGCRPGTDEWMKVWKAYPSLQPEMLTYSNLLKMGVNPIEAAPVDAFRVSNSALESAATCSVQALLKYGYRVVPQGEVFPLLIGTAIHAAMSVLFKTGDKQAAHAALLAVYPQGTPPKPNYEWDNINCIMTHYLNTF